MPQSVGADVSVWFARHGRSAQKGVNKTDVKDLVCCSETSVTTCQPALCNIPEDQRHQQNY
jgi:hypothetical protein